MFLGLDLGTSSLKALLVDGAQRVVAGAAVPLTVQRPAPGRSEQDPDAWWQALLDAVEALRATHGRKLAAVQAVGLCGHMHGAVLLDAAGAVLRPCILWDDARATAECAALEQAFPDLHAVAGNRAALLVAVDDALGRLGAARGSLASTGPIEPSPWMTSLPSSPKTMSLPAPPAM